MTGRRRFRLIRIAGCALFLAGCVTPSFDDPCADFGDVRYCPQSSQTMTPFTATRSVAITHARGTERLIVTIEIDEQGMRVAGVTPFGRRMLLIGLDRANRLTVESDVPLDARAILVGLQFSDWPLKLVRPGIRGESARLDVVSTLVGATRRLFDGEKLLMSATCEGRRPYCRRMVLRYETMNYTLDIESLDAPPKKRRYDQLSE